MLYNFFPLRLPLSHPWLFLSLDSFNFPPSGDLNDRATTQFTGSGVCKEESPNSLFLFCFNHQQCHQHHQQ